MRDREARAVLVTDGRVWVTHGAIDVQLLLRHPADLTGETVLLGVVEGRPLFAVDAMNPELGDDGRLAGLRELASALTPEAASIAAYAAALLNWHRRHNFCANCGSDTASRLGGLERLCSSCDTYHYPRTDPVVIVGVSSRNRLLLGHELGWPEGLFSVVAGYVEPGETLERAVRREVREESGLEVDKCRYLASQPWPFPGSVMLGFSAQANDGTPTADKVELAEARWFTRAEVEAAATGESEVSLPETMSISRWIIDDWFSQCRDHA